MCKPPSLEAAATCVVFAAGAHAAGERRLYRKALTRALSELTGLAAALELEDQQLASPQAKACGFQSLRPLETALYLYDPDPIHNQN